MTVQHAQNGIILYIEDEANDVFFMQEAFKSEGLADSLQVVRDGREAIAYLSGTGVFAERDKHPLPQLVLLDLNLPIVSGFEVLEWIKQQADLRDLPVVVFSSSGEEADRTKAMSLGAREFLQKPKSGLLFRTVVKGLRGGWF